MKEGEDTTTTTAAATATATPLRRVPLATSPALVTVAVVHEGCSASRRVLLCRRARDPCCGRWSLVGGCGAFKDDNDPAAAVALEVLCDTGEPLRDPTFFNYFYVPGQVLLAFSGWVSSHPVPNLTYTSELKWFDLEEAMKVPLAFNGNEILQWYFEHCFSGAAPPSLPRSMDAILFDLDGTLVDSQERVALHYQETATKFGLSASLEDCRRLRGLR
eukprot:TRINITY_DN3724_c0_g1_i2.p1 TRINITY_DN3724_c0_g1~~TRINITY_DN3724_c0_g1_i2.p1  ORF type:complete len:217 (-),score=62.96 TRINITY_DN3724_c0_g1_i2:584-1234(-)